MKDATHIAEKAAEINPKRGEIWRVDLEPTRGSEIRSHKRSANDTRPVLVLSRPKIGEPSVRLCAPITDYKSPRDDVKYWRVPLGDTPENKLHKFSCVDVSQTRALDLERFKIPSGRAHEAEVEESAASLCAIISAPEKKDPEKKSKEPK